METIPPGVASLNKPQPGARVQVNVYFKFSEGGTGSSESVTSFESTNWGDLISEFEFKGMLNGGYIISAKFRDQGYSLMNSFIEQGYLQVARKSPVIMKFNMSQRRIIDALGSTDSEMEYQTAYVAHLDAEGYTDHGCDIIMMAIDPPSWDLNNGNAFGGVFKGTVSDVLKKVVKEYSPGTDIEVSKTNDSDRGKWWMMRQDPKTFIKSLLDWSVPFNETKTSWIIAVDGGGSGKPKMAIKAQGELESKQRAQYCYGATTAHNTILAWSTSCNNMLAITNTQIITHGMSAISGKYIDKVTDKKKVCVKDTNTRKKIIPKVDEFGAFTKPDEDDGWTAVKSMPEIYSGGECGLKYREYIDGRARNMWLSMTNSVMKAKIRVIGHGIWRDTFGLGVDTIFLTWRSDIPESDEGDEFWYMTGHWIVYGFHHYSDRVEWYTDLYISRFDATEGGNDAMGKVVPKSQ